MNTLLNTNTVKISRVWPHFFGFFSCFIIGGIIAAIPRFQFFQLGESAVITFISELLRIPITLALFSAYSKLIFKRKIIQLGFSGTKLFLWGLIGFVLPFAVILFFALTSNIESWQYFPLNLNDTNNITNVLLVSLGMSLAAGITEEVLFRGYLFELLNRKYSFWVSALIPSLLFSSLHLGPAKTFLDASLILIAGILVSLMFLSIYKTTGSIWNAAIVHFLWNFLILNKLVSFNETYESKPVVEFVLNPNKLISGGDLGIEVSLFSIIVYLLASILIYTYFKFYDKKRA